MLDDMHMHYWSLDDAGRREYDIITAKVGGFFLSLAAVAAGFAWVLS